jgi:hypothetical protein
MPFEVNLHSAQNVYYQLLKTVYPTLCTTAAANANSTEPRPSVKHPPEPTALERFRALGAKLRVRVPDA